MDEQTLDEGEAVDLETGEVSGGVDVEEPGDFPPPSEGLDETAEPEAEWTPPTREQYEDLRRREDDAARARDGLRHEMASLRSDRRALQQTLEQMQQRLDPVAEQAKRQAEAQAALEREAAVPTDPVEKLRYDITREITSKLLPELEELKRQTGAVSSVVEQSRAHEAQLAQANQVAYRAQLEDSGCSSEDWNAVQNFEIARAQYYASPDGGSMAPEAARAQATQDRMGLYLELYQRQASGQMPGFTGPQYLAASFRSWGGMPNGNGGGGAESASVKQHRANQASEPPPAPRGRSDGGNDTGSLKGIARAVSSGRLSQEKLMEAVERATETLRKKNPGITEDDVLDKIHELTQH